ncbi:hypothetical protein Tco_0915811 [Tanacetum coccineum]
METKNIASLCSVSKEQEIQRLQEKARLLKGGCMECLKALQRAHSEEYCIRCSILKDTMIGDMDFIEKYMLETTLHQQEIQKVLAEKKLLQTQEVQSNTIQALKVDSIIMENTCSGIENKNSKTAFSKSFTLDYDSQMTEKYFVEYTSIEVKQFRDTLLQHLALDASLAVTENSRIKSEVQDESSRSRNDTNTDDADIRPIYGEEPMDEVQLTAECNIFATGQQHTEQPEIINEGRVD